MPFSVPTIAMPANEVQQFADPAAMMHQEVACVRAEMAANPNDPHHFLARPVQDAARQARQNTMEGPAPPMMLPEQLWTGTIRDDWTTANPHNPTLDWDLSGRVNFPIDIDSLDNNPPHTPITRFDATGTGSTDTRNMPKISVQDTKALGLERDVVTCLLTWIRHPHIPLSVICSPHLLTLVASTRVLSHHSSWTNSTCPSTKCTMTRMLMESTMTLP